MREEHFEIDKSGGSRFTFRFSKRWHFSFVQVQYRITLLFTVRSGNRSAFLFRLSKRWYCIQVQYRITLLLRCGPVIYRFEIDESDCSRFYVRVEEEMVLHVRYRITLVFTMRSGKRSARSS